MVGPHKKVHDNIAKAIALIEKDIIANADEVIRLFKETEISSDELFNHLDDMVKV